MRKFLEQTKDDSDYEDKVRKFLEETARWNRETETDKKHVEVEKKVKKKKKEKKIKDKDKEEKKLRKKKKKEERKKRKNKDKLERDLQESLPDLDQLQSKLSAYYAKVEKETAVIKRVMLKNLPSPIVGKTICAEKKIEMTFLSRTTTEIPGLPYLHREKKYSGSRFQIYLSRIHN